LTKWASRPNEGEGAPQYPAGKCKIMSRWERTLFTTPSVYYYPHHTSCGVDEMGKPAKDLVERVGGMGRPPGKIKNDIFQKWSVLGLRADFDFENLILASGFRNMWG